MVFIWDVGCWIWHTIQGHSPERIGNHINSPRDQASVANGSWRILNILLQLVMCPCSLASVRPTLLLHFVAFLLNESLKMTRLVPSEYLVHHQEWRTNLRICLRLVFLICCWLCSYSNIKTSQYHQNLFERKYSQMLSTKLQIKWKSLNTFHFPPKYSRNFISVFILYRTTL